MMYQKRSMATGAFIAGAAVACLGLGGWALTQLPGSTGKLLPLATGDRLPAPSSYIAIREPVIRLQFKPGRVPQLGRVRAWVDDHEATPEVKVAGNGLELPARPLPEGLHQVRIEYPPELMGLGRYLTYFYSSRWSFTIDTSRPRLELLEPKADTVLAPGPLDVKGITDPYNTLTIGGKPVTVGSDGHFSLKLTLEARKAIPMIATNRAGTTTQSYLSTKRPVAVHGIYITGWVGGMPDLLNKILTATHGTPINAVVVDLKDSTGNLTYPSKVPMAAAIKAIDTRIPDLKKVVEALEKHNLYSIARIAVMPDSLMAKKHPEWMVHRPDGSLWYDQAKLAWASPYAHPIWEYVIQIAKEAAQMGFREIQFDYVRFPSDGAIGQTVYPFKDKRKKVEAIRDFVIWARQELAPYDVFISADVFGLVTTGDDLGIGQNMRELSKHLDYICPMVYPSHYYTGAYGLKDPDAVPYQTVLFAMRGANQQTKGIEHIKVRPWLQWFSLRHKYGLEQINAQIRAINDAGMDEFLLWNPWNVYPKELLMGLRLKPARRPSESGSAAANLKNT